MTNDCDPYFFDTGTGACGTSGDADNDCDIGCGATFDADSTGTNYCNIGAEYTLSSDCTTCDAPVIDTEPDVNLVSPPDGGTVIELNVTFKYTVEDNHLKNCSLWHNFTGVFMLNHTNRTPIISNGATINNFTGNFTLDTDIRWNVNCTDNASQSGWGVERTVKIREVPAEVAVVSRLVEVYNGSDMRFSIDRKGDTNVSRDLYVGRDSYIDNDAYVNGEILDTSSTGVNIPRLIVASWIDIGDVRQDNPFNEYWRVSSTGDYLLPYI